MNYATNNKELGAIDHRLYQKTPTHRLRGTLGLMFVQRVVTSGDHFAHLILKIS